jgi:hypothetical protein
MYIHVYVFRTVNMNALLTSYAMHVSNFPRPKYTLCPAFSKQKFILCIIACTPLLSVNVDFDKGQR